MKPIITLSALMIALSLTACQRGNTNEIAAPMAGEGRDAHGCIPSAGFQWSPMRNACVKVFEAGLAFEPTAYNPDQTLRAYVLTTQTAGGKVTAAELFMPSEAQPWPLALLHTREGDIRPPVLESKEHKVRIYRTSEDAYMLERDGKVLFTFGPKDGNPLNQIDKTK
jgi:hypothetical protein